MQNQVEVVAHKWFQEVEQEKAKKIQSGQKSVEEAKDINRRVYQKILKHREFIQGREELDLNDVEKVFKNIEKHGIIGQMLAKTTQSIDTINEFGEFWQDKSDQLYEQEKVDHEGVVDYQKEREESMEQI